MPPAPLRSRLTRRDAALRRFARLRYGPRGTLALHRHAIGADLLRAPDPSAWPTDHRTRLQETRQDELRMLAAAVSRVRPGDRRSPGGATPADQQPPQ